VVSAFAGGLFPSLNVGAISCDSSLIKISLFGLEFMSTISVKPNRTY
jgi:hypothetical protein